VTDRRFSAPWCGDAATLFYSAHSKAVGHAKTGGFAFFPDQYR
jgi:hypothetical protein